MGAKRMMNSVNLSMTLGARPKLLLGLTLRFGQFADEAPKRMEKVITPTVVRYL